MKKCKISEMTSACTVITAVRSLLAVMTARIRGVFHFFKFENSLVNRTSNTAKRNLMAVMTVQMVDGFYFLLF